MNDTTYGADLEKIKVELANRRSEMANLARLTVADLEPKIPALQSKINTLTAEVSHLDSVIATKKKQADSDEQYWKKHYLELEDKLNKAHDARTATFKGKDDQYDARDKAHQDRVTDLKSREQSLANGQKQLTTEQNDFDTLVKQFKQEKIDNENKIRKIMDDLNGHINEANSEKLKQKSITENMEKQSLELAGKIKEAEAVIARIGEAQKKLDEAQVKEDNALKLHQQLDSREERINQLNAKRLADEAKLAADVKNVRDRERAATDRENNIKVAEASLKDK